MADSRGFALFWVPALHQARREGPVETLAKSSCGQAAT